MKTDTRKYCLIELRSGMKGICRYDRVEALVAAHDINKRNPEERWAICAV